MIKAGFVMLLLTGAGAAQADCSADWRAATTALEAGHGKVETGALMVTDGWCQLGATRFMLAGKHDPDIVVSSLLWRGDGVQGLFDFSVPPRALEMQITGLRLQVKVVDDPLTSYLLAVQGEKQGIDATLALHWDAATAEVILDHADFDFPGDNALVLTARVGNVRLDTLGAAQMSATSFAVKALHAQITTNGLFETYVLLPFGFSVLSPDSDPDAQLAALKAQLTAGIADLPEPSFAGDTKAALAAVVKSLPHPAGVLTLDMVSDSGVGPAQMVVFALKGMPRSVADVSHILKAMTVTATYVPTPLQ